MTEERRGVVLVVLVVVALVVLVVVVVVALVVGDLEEEQEPMTSVQTNIESRKTGRMNLWAGAHLCTVLLQLVIQASWGKL